MGVIHKVNLPSTLGGFTFKGEHSSLYGVRQTPTDRVLLPKKRRELLHIPGRSDVVIIEDNSYEPRVERIKCSYIKQEGVELQRQVRIIAGWLDGIGELSFDYEPEMKYQAYLSSAPPTIKTLNYATFDLEFTIPLPFAYEDPTTTQSVLSNGDVIPLDVSGTVDTPPLIIIKNVGTTNITSLVITHRNIG